MGLWGSRNGPVAPGMDSRLACGVCGDFVAIARVRARVPSAEDAETRRNPTGFACRPPPTACDDYWGPVPGGVPDPGKSEKKSIKFSKI